MNLLKLILLNVSADHFLGHKSRFSTHCSACLQDFVDCRPKFILDTQCYSSCSGTWDGIEIN